MTTTMRMIIHKLQMLTSNLIQMINMMSHPVHIMIHQINMTNLSHLAIMKRKRINMKSQSLQHPLSCTSSLSQHHRSSPQLRTLNPQRNLYFHSKTLSISTWMKHQLYQRRVCYSLGRRLQHLILNQIMIQCISSISPPFMSTKLLHLWNLWSNLPMFLQYMRHLQCMNHPLLRMNSHRQCNSLILIMRSH